MTTTNFTGLATTQQGRTRQLNKAFSGMAADMKNRQAVADVDCDQPQTLEEALRVIAYLQNKLADAQALLDADRAAAYSDAPVPSKAKSQYWSTARVAKESGNKAISTITRHAAELGGIKVAHEWLFPVNTVYGGQRKRKAK